MRTDTELIEKFITRKMRPHERALFLARRSSDSRLRSDLLAQAKVHLAVLLFGRNQRRREILAASEQAFAGESFSKQIEAIFQ